MDPRTTISQSIYQMKQILTSEEEVIGSSFLQSHLDNIKDCYTMYTSKALSLQNHSKFISLQRTITSVENTNSQMKMVLNGKINYIIYTCMHVCICIYI